MKWLITCHVWRKPINHPGKISVWNHHLEKLNIFVEHRNISVPKSWHLAFFNRFGGYPLPWKFDEWIPMQNWCLWKKYLQLHLFLILFSISMSYCKLFRGAPEFPTPRMLQSQFHVPTINFGGYVSCNIIASKFKTCLFPQSNHRPHDFCPHRNPYHMDAGQYFASIEFISTSKSHTIHVWYINLHFP